MKDLAPGTAHHWTMWKPELQEESKKVGDDGPVLDNLKPGPETPKIYEGMRPALCPEPQENEIICPCPLFLHRNQKRYFRFKPPRPISTCLIPWSKIVNVIHIYSTVILDDLSYLDAMVSLKPREWVNANIFLFIFTYAVYFEKT